MASALVTTPGFSTANSYCSVTDAAAYFGGRQVSAKWDALATDAAKDKILRNATLDIDRVFSMFDIIKPIPIQALNYPWVYTEASADSGSTTTAVCSGLKLSDWPNDYFNGGAVFVEATGDDAAPEFEIKEISDFVRSTGALTFGAFTAAIDAGDVLWVFNPLPQWLKNATCEQVYYLLTNDRALTGDDIQAGVSSKSNDAGSVSYQASPVADWLCRAAWTWINPYLPRIHRTERA